MWKKLTQPPKRGDKLRLSFWPKDTSMIVKSVEREKYPDGKTFVVGSYKPGMRWVWPDDAWRIWVED